MRRISQFILLPLLICALLLSPFAGCQSAGLSPANEGILDLWDIGPITLDPAISSEMTSHTYVMHIFSGLVSLDHEMEVAPDIAERWQESQDG